MTEITRIVAQMQGAFSGEAWHGPALQELLAKISAAQAAAQPFPHVHSIWEITLHIAVWKRIVRRRWQGEVVVEAPPAEDWPAVRATNKIAWATTQKELLLVHQELLEAVTPGPDARLDEIVPGQKISNYVMLHGVIQHDLYHAGQIAVLHRAQT